MALTIFVGCIAEIQDATWVASEACRSQSELPWVPFKTSRYLAACCSVSWCVFLRQMIYFSGWLEWTTGLYLTDVTFCREGNPSHRASPLNNNKKLLNFNKYHKLARIVQGEGPYLSWFYEWRGWQLELTNNRHAAVPSSVQPQSYSRSTGFSECIVWEFQA